MIYIVLPRVIVLAVAAINVAQEVGFLVLGIHADLDVVSPIVGAKLEPARCYIQGSFDDLDCKIHGVGHLERCWTPFGRRRSNSTSACGAVNMSQFSKSCGRQIQRYRGSKVAKEAEKYASNMKYASRTTPKGQNSVEKHADQ